MKGKKLLVEILSAAMVLGSMSLTALAEETDVYAVGAGKTYTDLASAFAADAVVDSDSNGVITYAIYGKVNLGTSGWASPVKAGSQIDTVNFVGMTADAGIVIETDVPYTSIDSYQVNDTLIAMNFKDLACSRPHGGWVNDLGHAGNYFVATLRNHGATLGGTVTYENCTFTNGVCNNFYGKTNFIDCNFENASEYGLWIYGGETTVNGDRNTFTGAKGVKVYSEDATEEGITVTIEKATFEITDKPAIVSSMASTITLKNVDATACAKGLISSEPKEGRSDLPYANITVDGEAPVFAAKVGAELFTDRNAAEAEANKNPASPKTVETIVAQIGCDAYTTLEAAVKAAHDGDTVKLLCDAAGNGIVVNPRTNNLTNLTIDFGGFTYTLDGTMVGSGTTTTNGFQLLAGADTSNPVNITFKNGKITSAKAYKAIQNYSNLTLEDMTVELTTVIPGRANGYTLSNNNGNVVLTGNTNIIAAKRGSGNPKVAFDVCRYSSYPAVTVTLDENMTGTIDGNIEFSNDTNMVVGSDKFNFTIKNGNVNGKFVDARAGEQRNVAIGAVSGGTFSDDSVKNYLADGFAAKKVGDKWIVDDSATELTLGFKKTTTDERVYDIVVTATDAAMINRLNTAELTFNLTASNADDSTVTYEILPVTDITVTPDNENTNLYMFNFNGKDVNGADTAEKITIGQVRFEGYTKNDATITFKTDMANSFVTATTKDGENVVTYFDGNGTLTADTVNKIENVKFAVPTKKLTVNITFPNAIADQKAAYQDMKVVISGGDLAENLVYKLGTGEGATALEGGAYKLVVDGKLTENTAYTVTVSGAGYRTARYTVTMTADKTLNFWNNVKDTPAVVEEEKDASKKSVTFLAGDIVKDGKINIYDLSAVVSYFGESGLSAENRPEYAKYDLNRDGKIDSKDVAYVLVSWGK